MNYLLYLPEDYEQRDAWPLLLFLHGAGERGNDLQRVQIHGPPKLIAEGKQFPFIVVSPHCPEDQSWDIAALGVLLDDLAENYKVDLDRVYVTGLSMGGFGTWGLAQRWPHRFAAILPICGGGDRQFARHIKHIPTWVFHGSEDRAVPLERSTEMVEALEKVGGNVKLTVYPDVGHDSWTETYNKPEVYEWLLQHKRK